MSLADRNRSCRSGEGGNGMAAEDVTAENPWVQRAGLDADAMGGGT